MADPSHAPIRSRRLRLASIACACAGVALRFDYALGHHHLRHRASSDALQYLEQGQRLLSPGAVAELGATIWPPGTSALWALLSALDPAQDAAAAGNALASVAVMLLSAAIAGLLAGARAGWMALAIAALHPGFIHYAGFALAEQAFQLTAAVALYLTLSALVTLDGRLASCRRRLWIAGIAVGSSWGLSVLFRPNALPVLACGALALFLRHRRELPRSARSVGLAAALGLALVLGAAAERCTRTAGGRFCLVSNNIAMNMALGQAGQFYGLEFRDPARPEEASTWVPPALLHHGYQGVGHVPASIYDTAGVLRWLGERFVAQPGLFCVRALGNAFDLFGLDYWPADFGRWAQRLFTVWAQAFFALVMVPALFAFGSAVRAMVRGPAPAPALTFVAAGLCGLLLSAAISLGEARYRMPFDGLWIALASALYARAEPGVASARELAARHFPAWACAIAVAVFALIGLSHPELRLGARLAQRATPLVVRPDAERQPAAQYASPRAPGSPWNAPGNHRWHCRPACRELRLAFDGPRGPGRVELSVDHNDRYRIFFYRGEQRLAHRDVTPEPYSPSGLRVVRLEAPTGFDALGVLPLYGDGAYALGHVSAR